MGRLITVSVALLIIVMSLDLASIKKESVYFNHEDIKSIHPFHVVMNDGIELHGVNIKELYFNGSKELKCLKYCKRTSLLGMYNINYFIK